MGKPHRPIGAKHEQKELDELEQKIKNEPRNPLLAALHQLLIRQQLNHLRASIRKSKP